MVPHAYDDLVESHMPYESIVSRFNNAAITAMPGQIYGYQNVLFGLVDTIFAEKTSMYYSELVAQKIFHPLAMKNASTDFIRFRDNPNKAFPHRGGGGVYQVLPLNDRYYSVKPAAGVNASISDMAHFIMALLRENDPLLQASAAGEIFAPQVVTPLSRGYFREWDRVNAKYYGLGWRIVDYKGRRIAYHGGFVSGYKAEIALCKEENVGIVYLTNSPNLLASQSVPKFFNALFDYKDRNHDITRRLTESENSSEGS
jgi:beta-lactamase class C